MQKLDGLKYKDAQKRNSKEFYKLSRNQQKLARQSGYKNVGWVNVRNSWRIIQNFDFQMAESKDNVIDMYSYKATKGNLTAENALDEAILQTEILLEKGEELSKSLLSKLR